MDDKASISLALSTSKNSLLLLAEKNAREAAEAARAAMAEVAASKDDPPRLREARVRARKAVEEVRMAMQRVRRAKDEARKDLERRARELKERQRRRGIEEPTILPTRHRRSESLLTLPDRQPSTDPRALAPFLLMCETIGEEELLKKLIRIADLAVQGSQLISQHDGKVLDVKVRVAEHPVDFRLGQRILVLVDHHEASAARNQTLTASLEAEGYTVLRFATDALERDPTSAAEQILGAVRQPSGETLG